MSYAINTYWYVALGCAAVTFFIVSQYLIALLWKAYKLHTGGKRAVARMRNLKPGEPLEPQPPTSPELATQAAAEVSPIGEQQEPLEPQPAVNQELLPHAGTEGQAILKDAEPLQREPAASPERDGQTGAKVPP
ncbi:MAG: hypothetical protein P8Y53_11540, partial [Pseudolabrys sp.]